ncbi:MAG: hypothetical protein JFR41_05855 [Muribaculaceae bacterium]|nr:hypothetical protein [Muribaculaceae bacterium]
MFTTILTTLAAMATVCAVRLRRHNRRLIRENRQMFHDLISKPHPVPSMERCAAALDRRYTLHTHPDHVAVSMRVPYAAADPDFPTSYALVPVKSFPCGDDPAFALLLATELLEKLNEK